MADEEKRDVRETKALVPEETKPAPARAEVKLLLAHHWEDHLPGDTVTLPEDFGLGLEAQGYGKVQR